MTTDEQGRSLKYDAWNRLVKVEQNGNVVSQYQYDGLKRRITEQQGTQPQRVLYYSANWQVLEERESGVVQAQQVWSPVYVDALILRDRNANGISGDGPGGSGLEQRQYVAQDANFNVTALIDGSTGAVVERYYYQAYGVPTVLDANFVPRANGQSQFAWRYLHQGGRFDWEAGYYHFRNRDLSPTLGRWLNHDPIGFQGSKWNLYEFVEGRPTVGLDPLGLALIIGPPHQPGGPDELFPNHRNRCYMTDSCDVLFQKIINFSVVIASHILFDLENPNPDYPNGRHESDILTLRNGLRRCEEYFQRKCMPRIKPCRPCPNPAPAPQPSCEIRIEPRTVVVCVGGAAGGYFCYRAIRMIPSLFCPPTIPLNLACP